jgi:hypothetical protein
MPTEPINTPFDPTLDDDPDDLESFNEYVKGGEYDAQSDAYYKLIGYSRPGA